MKTKKIERSKNLFQRAPTLILQILVYLALGLQEIFITAGLNWSIDGVLPVFEEHFALAKSTNDIGNHGS